tara:strand:- start:273 stop:3149 length:2877 start_codon:yes stop_codon:yes gene_type:complete
MLGVSSGLSKIGAKPRRKYAAYFDGTGDYMDTGRTFQSTFQGSFSISLWVQPSDGQPATADVLIGSANHASDAEDSVYIAISDSGDVAMNHRSNNVNGYLITTYPVFPNGATDWTHIAATYTKVAGGNTTYKLYINGYEVVLTNSGSAISEANHAAFASTYNLYIGGNNAAGSLSTPYTGYIDEVAIFNKALTAAEVEGLYNSGKPFNLMIPSYISTSATIDSYGGYTEYTSGKLEAYWKMWGGKKAPTGVSFDNKRGIVLDQVASTGTELITNGSFGSNVSNWSVKTNDPTNGMSSGGTLSHDTDKLKFVGTAGDVGWQGVISDSFTLVPGKKYKMSAKFTTAAGNAQSCYLRLTTSTAWTGLHYVEVMNVGLTANNTWDNSVIFTNHTGTTMYVQAMCPTADSGGSGSSHTFYLDDVSLVEVGDVFGDELYTGTSGDDANWGLNGDAAKTEDTATGSVKISNNTGDAYLKFRSSTSEFSTNLTVGETYLCSFLAKRTGTSDTARFKAQATNSAFLPNMTEEFKRYYLYFVCSDVDDNMIQTSGTASKEFFIKDISLRKLNGNPALCAGGATDNRNHAATQTMSSVLSLDGVGDYLDVGNVLDFGTADFSVSAWIKANDLTHFPIITKYIDTDNVWRLVVGSDDKIAWLAKADGNETGAGSGATALTALQDSWIHVCVSGDRDGSYVMYVNGTTSTYGKAAATMANSSQNLDNSGPIYIGRYEAYSGNQYATGWIDEVAIWNVALDADAVAAIHTAGRNYGLTTDTGNYDNSSALQAYWKMDISGDVADGGFVIDQNNVGFGSELWDATQGDDANWALNLSGTNTKAEVDGSIQFTYVDNSTGGYIYLNDSKDLSTDLTVEAVYRCTFETKTNTGTSNWHVNDGAASGSVNYTSGNVTTEWQTKNIYFKAKHTQNAYLMLTNMGSGEVTLIKNISLKKANGYPAITIDDAATIRQPV